MNPVATMTKKRHSASSVVIGHRLWVTGGYDENDKKLNSTEFVDPESETVQPGPDLPEAVYGHCLVKTDATTAMLIGYHSYGYRSWFFNFVQEEKGWVEGPDLHIGRSHHACGVISDLGYDAKKIVIAAGGKGKSTEVFVIGSKPEEWIVGPDLLVPKHWGAGVTMPDRKGKEY